MIVAAAVCPGAPLLIPGLAPAIAAQVPVLVDGCDTVVRSLARVERILLLTSRVRRPDDADSPSARSLVHPAGTWVSSAPLSGTLMPAHYRGRLAGSSTRGHEGPPGATTPGRPAGVAVAVGAALLAAADITAPVTAIELSAAERAAGGLRTGAASVELLAARESAARVALLVIADGSASRGADSPGGGHRGAAALDDALAQALAGGSPAMLEEAASIDPDEAAGLLFASGPAFLGLAELTRGNPPVSADLLHNDAPFGVGYLVARWRWA